MQKISVRRLRWAPPILLLGQLCACGHLYRFEVGPEFIQDEDPRLTTQVTAGLPIIAGSGIYDALIIGGWATAGTQDLTVGILFGCDVGIAPGTLDLGARDHHAEHKGPVYAVEEPTQQQQIRPRQQQVRPQRRGKSRRGFGGALRLAPRARSDGLDLGGGIALTYGSANPGDKHRWSLGGRKGVSIRWQDFSYTSFGVATELHRRRGPDGFDSPRPWRFTGLFLIEHLKVTE